MVDPDVQSLVLTFSFDLLLFLFTFALYRGFIQQSVPINWINSKRLAVHVANNIKIHASKAWTAFLAQCATLRRSPVPSSSPLPGPPLLSPLHAPQTADTQTNIQTHESLQSVEIISSCPPSPVRLSSSFPHSFSLAHADEPLDALRTAPQSPAIQPIKNTTTTAAADGPASSYEAANVAASPSLVRVPSLLYGRAWLVSPLLDYFFPGTPYIMKENEYSGGLYLRFYQFVILTVACLTILSVVLLMPVYLTSPESGYALFSWLHTTSVANCLYADPRLWTILAALLLILPVLYIFVRNLSDLSGHANAFIRRRQQQSSMESRGAERTILISNIPQRFPGDPASLLHVLFPPPPKGSLVSPAPLGRSSVVSVNLMMDCKTLEEAVKQVETDKEQVDKMRAELCAWAGPVAESTDALSELERRLAKAEQQANRSIKRLKASLLAYSRVNDGPTKTAAPTAGASSSPVPYCLGYCFLSFSSRASARAFVVRCRHTKTLYHVLNNHYHNNPINDPNYWTVDYSPPARDINYGNLSYDSQSILRFIVANGLLFFVVLFVALPAIISHEVETIINEEANGLIAPASPAASASAAFTAPTTHTGLLFASHYLTTLIVYIVNEFYSPFVMLKSLEIEKHITKSSALSSHLWKQISFLFINLILLPVFALNTINQLYNRLTAVSTPQGAFQSFLANCSSLFVNSQLFYIQYLIQALFYNCSLSLLEIPQKLRRAYLRSKATTDRQRRQADEKYPFRLPNMYANVFIVFAILLLHFTSIPFLLPFGLLYLIGNYYMDSHTLTHTPATKYTDGGLVILELNRYSLLYIILFLCLIGFYFFAQQTAAFLAVSLLCFLVAIVLLLFYLVRTLGLDDWAMGVMEKYAGHNAHNAIARWAKWLPNIQQQTNDDEGDIDQGEEADGEANGSAMVDSSSRSFFNSSHLHLHLLGHSAMRALLADGHTQRQPQQQTGKELCLACEYRQPIWNTIERIISTQQTSADNRQPQTQTTTAAPTDLFHQASPLSFESIGASNENRR